MDDTEDMRTAVELHIYDLTKGMAAMMSRLLIGECMRIIGVYIRTLTSRTCIFRKSVSSLKRRRLRTVAQFVTNETMCRMRTLAEANTHNSI